MKSVMKELMSEDYSYFITASITTMSAAEPEGVVIYATPLPEKEEGSELIETLPSLSNHFFFSASVNNSGTSSQCFPCYSVFILADGSSTILIDGIGDFYSLYSCVKLY